MGASKILQQIYEIHKKALGTKLFYDIRCQYFWHAKDPDTLMSYNNLVSSMESMGDFKGASKIYNKFMKYARKPYTLNIPQH